MRADDAVYHNQCNVNFRTGKQIPFILPNDTQKGRKSRETNRGRPYDDMHVEGFRNVVLFFEENDDQQVTITDLTVYMGNLLKDSDVDPYDVRYMKQS